MIEKNATNCCLRRSLKTTQKSFLQTFLMLFPSLNIIDFPIEVLSGVIAGLICKAYFVTKMKSKLKNYQDDIIKSQERILELEDLNDKLEKRLKDLEGQFSKDRISLN